MTLSLEGERSRTRVPPSNLEAEESVLGAVMLSTDAANAVIGKLQPEDFYKPAHQVIYQAILGLYNANQPIDAVTVSDALRRSEQLERMGGISSLTDLLEAVPTATNVGYYADIVEEHALRRRLVRAGTVIGELAFETDTEVDEVLDQAEQTVFGVAERRVGEGLMPLRPLIPPTLEAIEEIGTRGTELAGLSTGFRDLDRKLGGLQPANLMIVAGRPSMGKCLPGVTRIMDAKTGELVTLQSLADERDNITLVHTMSLDVSAGRLTPSVPIALHDNGMRETFRLTSRLGREIVATGNHPLLTIKGWQSVSDLKPGDCIAVPRRLDVFGVDELPDAEVALLGYLIGDGCLTGTTPRITISDRRILEDVSRYAADLGAELTIASEHRTAPSYRLARARGPSQRDIAQSLGMSTSTVGLVLTDRSGPAEVTAARVRAMAQRMDYKSKGANPVAAILKRHGLLACGSHTKFVPEAVFRLPKRQVALFLSRLYATDGSAWVSRDFYRIEYCTVSERLASDVQHLLLRFGILAKRRKRRIKYGGDYREAWDVSFQDPESVEIFAREIGIFSKEEQVAAVLERARSRRTRRSAADLLPHEVWEAVFEEKGDRSWRSISTALGLAPNWNWHIRRRLTRTMLARLAEALDSDRLRALAHSEVVWDPIVSITPAGRQRTFDLTVPIYENFVADDVVVHNSALALNIAQNVASHGDTVAVFSLEMSLQELVQRMLCSLARVDSHKLRTGQLGALWQKVVQAAGQLYELPLFLDESASLTATDIRAKCRRLKRQHGLGLVLVDYVQLMRATGRAENRQQEIAEISRSLKGLARELDVPIIAVSQLNRALETRQDKHPLLGDLRESGELEQAADVVLFIYRDEYYHPENVEAKGLADVEIAKHRNGATGRVQMTFLAEFTLFADMGRDVAA